MKNTYDNVFSQEYNIVGFLDKNLLTQWSCVKGITNTLTEKWISIFLIFFILTVTSSESSNCWNFVFFCRWLSYSDFVFTLPFTQCYFQSFIWSKGNKSPRCNRSISASIFSKCDPWDLQNLQKLHEIHQSSLLNHLEFSL